MHLKTENFQFEIYVSKLLFYDQKYQQNVAFDLDNILTLKFDFEQPIERLFWHLPVYLIFFYFFTNSVKTLISSLRTSRPNNKR